MNKVIRILVLSLIIILFGGTIVFLYSKSKKRPVFFSSEKAFKTNIVQKTVATGSIVPRKEIEIKPQVSGIIEEIYVEPGNKVVQGDLIAKVKVIPNMLNLNNAESRVNKAKISYEDAKIEYQRQKKLYENNVIPHAEYIKTKLAYDNAVEEVESAESNLQLIRDGVSKKSSQTTNTLIRSTISGMVLDVPIEVGNSVIETNTFNPGTTIALVANMGEMVFEGKVDETEVGKIKLGMPLLLSVGAIEDVKFNADLEYIAPKGVEENGAIQFEIKADVKLIDTLFIRSGYSANADIVLAKKDSVLAIKESLLQFENGNEDSIFVEIETGEQLWEKKFIEVGLSDGVNIEILAGIEPDQKIKVPKPQKKDEEKKK